MHRLEFWGGRMASAQGGSVPNGVGYGERCPLSSRLGGLGSVGSSRSGVRGRAPAENGFWRILKATERSFLYLYDKNLRGTICTSVPLLQILGGGTCPPRPPWSTPMVLCFKRLQFRLQSLDFAFNRVLIKLSVYLKCLYRNDCTLLSNLLVSNCPLPSALLVKRYVNFIATLLLAFVSLSLLRSVEFSAMSSPYYLPPCAVNCYHFGE